MSSRAKKVTTESPAEGNNKVNNDCETEPVGYHHFPAENIPQIWLNIFEKLGQEDKLTFSQASKEWHDWVALKRTDFLFPQVAIYLWGAIPKSSAKQCRSVCRSWTQKLDSLSEFYPTDMHFAKGTEYEEVDNFEFFVLTHDFNSANQIQRFMADMSAHPGNPLPGGSIYLEYQADESGDPLAPGEMDGVDTEYWTAVIMLLRKYGNYIQDATFLFHEDAEAFPLIEITEHFRNCLLNIPNLRHITLDHSGTERGDEMEEYLRLNPFPRLQKLEVVDIHDVDFDLAEAFLNHCCVPANIKRVWIWVWRIPRTVYTFFNLEILQARSDDLMIEDLEGFRNLSRVPPLRVLRVHANSDLNALRVFTALEAFVDTITEFTVMSPLVNNAADAIAGIQINLPKLESICFADYQGSLDLLLQLTSLKDLEIRTATMEREEWDGNVVQFYGFEERLKESNIWDLIPSLQTIAVGHGENEFTYER
ncbi:unnamed protein product [Orchesella dallaii]|uniref:F-box domain-containing protein n=1 Tax=Orchesella dallaii TaxID=48710 RepID=A0ABP1SAG1_9HEXA